MNTADLKRPAQMLLAAKAVRTTGAKRGTKYHVGSGGGSGSGAGTARKARAKKARPQQCRVSVVQGSEQHPKCSVVSLRQSFEAHNVIRAAGAESGYLDL